MTGGRRLGALALLGALAPQLGCSFLFVDKPTVSAGYAQGSNCTSSPAAPIIDAALTLWQGARAVSAASGSDSEYQGGGAVAWCRADPEHRRHQPADHRLHRGGAGGGARAGPAGLGQCRSLRSDLGNLIRTVPALLGSGAR